MTLLLVIPLLVALGLALGSGSTHHYAWAMAFLVWATFISGNVKVHLNRR